MDAEWLDEREARAWRGLQMMNHRVDGELGRRLAEESEISLADYAVLVTLTEHPEGRMRPFELGCELSWEKSRLSHHVGRMVKRGLVAKESCPNDGRGAFVVVTPQGRAEIERAAPGHVRDVRRLVIDHLDDDDLDALARITERVLAGFEAATNPCDG